MKIDTAEITNVIKQEVQRYATELEVSQVGQVIEVGDGIARIYGLSKAMAGEMLAFEVVAEEGHGPAETVYGQVFNLESDIVGAVIFGDYLRIKEGDQVRSTGELLSVPVGEGVLGRVINALGQPMDGQGPIQSTERRKVDIIAPGIADRQPVKQPLQTGVKAIDSMIPIGRGQRELIIGEGTAKTGENRRRQLMPSSTRPTPTRPMSRCSASTWRWAAKPPASRPWWRRCGRTAPWNTPRWSSPPRQNRRRCSTSHPTPAVPLRRRVLHVEG